MIEAHFPGPERTQRKCVGELGMDAAAVGSQALLANLYMNRCLEPHIDEGQDVPIDAAPDLRPCIQCRHRALLAVLPPERGARPRQAK